MSEQINKVLADRPQSFTTAEQLQARTNIGAQASGDYVSSTTFTTFSSRMESAKQDSSAMSSYVPFSAISADGDSAITSIKGSSVGKFTGVSAGDNLSGNGTSASPLGLNSSVNIHDAAFPYKDTYISAGSIRVSGAAYAGMQVYRDQSAYVNINDTGIQVQHTASGIGDNSTASYYGEVFSLCYNGGDYYLKEISADGEGIQARDLNTPNLQSVYGFGKAKFTDDSKATWEVVDASSIRRWNSYSGASGNWNESGNSLSTGYGGNPVTAASQYNADAGNWAARTVKISGLPDQTLYGFQTKPNGTATAYMVNPAGAFVQYQSNYYTYLYHRTGAVYEDLGSSIYPTGLTGNARLDFVNLCSAASANIKTDTFHGVTADFKPGESATMWYIATAGIWTDGLNSVPV